MESIGSIILASLAATIVIALLVYALFVIANWKIFTKAGEAGWKSLIPVYNGYILYKISWNVKYFWILLAACIGCGIVQGMEGTAGSALQIVFSSVIGFLSLCQACKLAKAFGHGNWFACGLIFLPNIFTLILGFDSSEYIGPQ